MLTVEVTDAGGLTDSATVTIALTDVAEGPVTKFYVVDTSADDAFRYEADGTAVGATNLTGDNSVSRGVAADATGSTFWVIDSDDRVYVGERFRRRSFSL